MRAEREQEQFVAITRKDLERVQSLTRKDLRVQLDEAQAEMFGDTHTHNEGDFHLKDQDDYIQFTESTTDNEKSIVILMLGKLFADNPSKAVKIEFKTTFPESDLSVTNPETKKTLNVYCCEKPNHNRERINTMSGQLFNEALVGILDHCTPIEEHSIAENLIKYLRFNSKKIEN